MKRFLTISRLKPDMIARYIALHDSIGVDVVAAAHAYHLRNFSIHRVGLYLFSYYEYVGTDYEADMRAKNETPVMQRWRQETGACFDDVAEETRTLIAEEIFHNDF